MKDGRIRILQAIMPRMISTQFGKKIFCLEVWSTPNVPQTVFVLALLCGLTSMSAEANTIGKVGVNSLFILEYALSRGVPCPGCPGNVQPHALSEIKKVLRDLAINQNVVTFREIVPLVLLAPNGTSTLTGTHGSVDTTNYSVIDSVVDLFKAGNLRLILAIGNPIPAWAAPWGHRYSCFLPPAANLQAFDTLKNNISWTMGKYLNHLKNRGFSTWMADGSDGKAGGLFIEGFNEWNGNASFENCGDFTAATPQRAAMLEAGIARVAAFYGVRIHLAAPSIVFPTQGLGGWYTAYYAAGGIGAPNVHIYGNGTAISKDSESAILFAKSQLTELINVIPRQYKTSVIWGETGFGEASSVCQGATSLASDDWTKYDVSAAKLISGSDAAVTRAVNLLTIWRLDRIDNQSSCEGSFGILSSDLKTYLSAGVQMLRYLGGSGVMSKRR